ncbi:MAG: lysine--tRNA ligase, partial [Flavobacteriaceae bacterium]|nr:lysine--tRNA ligase [Flavobacteriaceae bacterium]
VAADIQLSEDEKSVFKILQKAEKILLNDLKTESGLSNKKWDKTIKGLTKKEVAKVSKTDEGLFVESI